MVSYPWSTYNSGQINDTEYENFARGWQDNGYFGQPTDPEPVYADGSGMHVFFRGGSEALVRGRYFSPGTTDEQVTVTDNSSGSPRTDRAILRYDRSSTSTNGPVVAAVLEGTPGAGPPALTQTEDGIYEVHVRYIQVASAATNISAGDVTGTAPYLGTRIIPTRSTDRPDNPIRGQLIYEFDTGRWLGATPSWVVLYDDSGDVVLSVQGSWSAFQPATIRRRNGWASLRLGVTRVNVPFRPSADNVPIVVVPEGFRPSVSRFTTAFAQGSAMLTRLDVNGEIQAFIGPTVDVGNSLWIDMTWPVA